MDTLIPETEQKEKKSRLTELFAFVGVMVSIIIAGTTLWNYSGNVPSWWFQSSFIFLVLLTFFTIVIFFHKPLSERTWKFRLQRKLRQFSGDKIYAVLSERLIHLYLSDMMKELKALGEIQQLTNLEGESLDKLIKDFAKEF